MKKFSSNCSNCSACSTLSSKEKRKVGKNVKTIDLESLVAAVILHFCENAAELGCPKDVREVDMWFRYLSEPEMIKVGSKLLDIIERDHKRFNGKSKAKKK